MKQRDIRRMWTTTPRQENANRKMALLLEQGNWAEFDPFLMLAEDWFRPGVFDFHPHRGLETVTYIIEGTLEHYDNKGGQGVLEAGDAQWMTAGRGIIHKETPPEGQLVHTLQLWLNLPSSRKMTAPRYQDLHSADLPERLEEGARVRVFSGSSAEVSATTQNHVPVTMVEITLEPGATVQQDLPGSYNGFIYILEGSGTFGASKTEGKQNQVLWLGSGEGEQESAITIQAQEKLRLLLWAGEPVKEPVVAYGPFVMNTEAEIKQAYADYHTGKFDEIILENEPQPSVR
jgi:quercetin 2,3-dioxygenase